MAKDGFRFVQAGAGGIPADGGHHALAPVWLAGIEPVHHAAEFGFPFLKRHQALLNQVENQRLGRGSYDQPGVGFGLFLRSRCDFAYANRDFRIVSAMNSANASGV